MGKTIRLMGLEAISFLLQTKPRYKRCQKNIKTIPDWVKVRLPLFRWKNCTSTLIHRWCRRTVLLIWRFNVRFSSLGKNCLLEDSISHLSAIRVCQNQFHLKKSEPAFLSTKGMQYLEGNADRLLRWMSFRRLVLTFMSTPDNSKKRRRSIFRK